MNTHKVHFNSGLEIINDLRAAKMPAGSIARKLGVTRAYVYQIIYDRNRSWCPGAMKVRRAVACALKKTPGQIWMRS